MADTGRDDQDAADQPGQPPTRVCPSCSAQSETFSDTCPYCGASFIRSRAKRVRKRIGSWPKASKVAALLVIATLIGGGVAVGVIAKVNHDNEVAQQQTEEEEKRERAQAEKAEEEKLATEELKAEEELERIEAKYGRESVNELEVAITDDANSEAEEGISDYVSETSCEAEGGRVDTTLTAQNFSCLAVTTEEGGVQEGYRYTGAINYVKGNLSWRLGGP